MMRNGNVFPVFPPDANSIQVCYDWALTTQNKGVVTTASKSPLPIRTTFAQTRQGLEDGAVVLQEISGDRQVVFAVIGDMTHVFLGFSYQLQASLIEFFKQWLGDVPAISVIAGIP